MYIAFYKGKETRWDKLICYWTKSIYSHCEIVFSNDITFSADYKPYRTRFKNVSYDRNLWDLYKLEVNKKEEDIILQFCKEENNCWYDIIGILFTQILPLSFQSPWWWFCSELCCAALQKIGMFSDIKPHYISPGDLSSLLTYTRRVRLPGEYIIT